MPQIQFIVEIQTHAGAMPLLRDYEQQVRPVMEAHGGRLERVWQAKDQEFHLMVFESEAGFDAFNADPRRLELSAKLSRVITELTRSEVTEVPLDLYFGD